MRSWVPCLACLVIGAQPALASKGEEEEGPARFVISMGYNAGAPDPRPTLQYADDDAARFFMLQMPAAEKAWLLTTFDAQSAGAYPDLSRLARPPTRLELARVLGEIAWQVRDRAKRGRTTELVFYFAGHGSVTPSGEGFLVLPDGPFTRTQLQEQIVIGSPTDVNHLIVDACASYFMVTPRGEDDEASSGQVTLSPTALDVLRADDGYDAAAWARTGVIVSTSGSAAVHETPALGSGVFSYLLRSALLGGADLNGDGLVEYGEAAGFIAASSSELPDARARLQIHARGPQQRPHAALSDLGQNVEHFLALSGDGPGRVRVLDAQGLPYAEVHREKGSATLLALVGSPFFTVQVGSKEALLVPRSPGAYSLMSLDFSPSPVRRGLSYDLPAGLFEAPFGPAWLGGFLTRSELTAPSAARALEIPHAVEGAPPARLPLKPLAVSAFAGAGVFVLASSAAAVMNLSAFAQLERGVTETGALDADAALAVEAWRTGAALSGAAAVGLTLAGTAGWLWAEQEEEAPWE